MSKDPLELVKIALKPDHHSKIAYAGRIQQIETVTVFTENGTPIQKDVPIFISWDSIAELLELIAKRAKLQ